MHPENLRNLEVALKKQFTLTAREVESVRECLRGAILALEVERAAIAKTGGQVEADLQAILGLGVMLGDLQKRRVRLTELAARMPSPNRLQQKEKLAATAGVLTKKIFDTVEHLKNVQAEIYKLARLNLRAASWKLVMSEKGRARAGLSCAAN